MRTYQVHETGTRHATRHIGGGSDHEGAKLFGCIVIIVVLALLALALNHISGVGIDALVSLV